MCCVRLTRFLCVPHASEVSRPFISFPRQQMKFPWCSSSPSNSKSQHQESASSPGYKDTRLSLSLSLSLSHPVTLRSELRLPALGTKTRVSLSLSLSRSLSPRHPSLSFSLRSELQLPAGHLMFVCSFIQWGFCSVPPGFWPLKHVFLQEMDGIVTHRSLFPPSLVD